MNRRGFTLVELLVVIGVIAILMSITLSAIGRAREKARAIKCLSNLRQMVISAETYANNYRDYYPIAYRVELAPVFTSVSWDFTTTKDWSTNPPKTVVTPGLLWEGKTAKEIHQCPSFKGAHNWLADPYTGYNYNTSYIGHGSGESNPIPAKRGEVHDPTNTAIFGDGQYASGANKFMRSPWASPGDAGFTGRFAGTQGYRHLGSTNVALCDGHAVSWKERYTDTYESDKANITENTGFLSPDNSMYDLE